MSMQYRLVSRSDSVESQDLSMEIRQLRAWLVGLFSIRSHHHINFSLDFFKGPASMTARD